MLRAPHYPRHLNPTTRIDLLQVFSQLSRITREMGYVCPTFSRFNDKASGTAEPEKFEGVSAADAFVILWHKINSSLDVGWF